MKSPGIPQVKKLLSLMVVLSFMAAVLTACISTDPLYGTWIEPNSGVQMEIKKNGEILTSLNGTTFSMSYTLEVPDLMIIAGSKDGSVPEQKVKYTATSDSLTLTVDGIDTVFDRKK